MSDVTSMFMMYTLELYKWANDTAFLQQMWPYVAKGAQWQMSVSQQYGLPAHLVSTYDILGLDKYPVATYNSIFHLMAMRVCVELSTVMGNQTLANQCQAALTRGQQALDNMLWVEQTGNVSSYYAAVYGVNASLMADSFYGQVLAFSAGLGVLSNATRMASHLQAEYERNDTPFGLRVMTGPTIGDTNTDVWQGMEEGGRQPCERWREEKMEQRYGQVVWLTTITKCSCRR